jgi:hypothetical protein
MTDHSAIADDLDAELARRVDAERRMATALVELERHAGHVLLSTITPTGRTAQRWAGARDALAGLWQDFATYQGVVAAARDVTAPAERCRLLREPSIEVSRTVVERRLTGDVEHVETITLEQLSARMEAAFRVVDDIVRECAGLHGAFLAGLAPLGLDALRHAVDEANRELRAAHGLAAGLLERRAELRGRFESYRAKAGRLGHAEHPDLLRLGGDVRRLLWSRPCDLAAATRVLVDYQRMLQRAHAAGQGRPA